MIMPHPVGAPAPRTEQNEISISTFLRDCVKSRGRQEDRRPRLSWQTGFQPVARGKAGRRPACPHSRDGCFPPQADFLHSLSAWLIEVHTRPQCFRSLSAAVQGDAEEFEGTHLRPRRIIKAAILL